MLRWRLILGTLLVALLAGLCWADAQAARPGIFLVPLAVVLCLVATQEMLAMFRAGNRDPRAATTYVGTLLPVLAACAPIAWQPYPTDCPIGRLGWLACGLAAGLLVALFGEMLRYQQPGKTISNLAPTALAILYVGGLLGFLIQLRLLPDSNGASGPRGMAALLSLIVAVKLSDIGQFTCGKLFGKRRLAPRLSPGKTWEGAIGGVGLSVVVSYAILPTAFQRAGVEISPAGLACYCVLVCWAGIFGDLAESMLKRDAGVKDSSTWLPGFGGVLDLLDSLLAAAPVAYLCWVSGLL